jgi:hypothetical protein
VGVPEAATTIPEQGILIDGDLVRSSDGAELPAANPAGEGIVGSVPDATAGDGNLAVIAAQRPPSA